MGKINWKFDWLIGQKRNVGDFIGLKKDTDYMIVMADIEAIPI